MTTAVAQPDDTAARWGANIPHVRKALAFVKRRGSVTAEELVEWDRSHGRRLFNWDDPAAAEEWRRQQARMFLNRFRAQFEGMRVRAFIHVRENEPAGIERDAYYTIEEISKHKGMREQVIADVTKRMERLGSELSMWKLEEPEQDALFNRLRAAMNSEDQQQRKSA